MESVPLKPASIAGGHFDHYFHTCAFFRDKEEEYRILAPFLAEGLGWGEKGLSIVDPKEKQGYASRLEAHGAPISANPDQFELLTWDETYLRDGRFDKDQMLDAVQNTIAAGREKGFPRTRIVGHMGWALEGHPGTDRILEYEVEVNEVLARQRHPAVCVYDVNKLTGSLMMELLRAHPLTIINGSLHENPFYVPAEQMLADLRTRRRRSTH